MSIAISNVATRIADTVHSDAMPRYYFRRFARAHCVTVPVIVSFRDASHQFVLLDRRDVRYSPRLKHSTRIPIVCNKSVEIRIIKISKRNLFIEDLKFRTLVFLYMKSLRL